MNIRVATWNLERAKPGAAARIAAQGAHMAAIDADLWVLTETWDAIAPGEGHRLVAHSGPAPDREAAHGEVWTAIWSRLEAEPLTLEAEPDRSAAALITLPSGRRLILFGTVLPWLGDKRRAPCTGKRAFIASLAAQQDDWRRLRGRYPEADLIVAGDFNQDLASTHYYGSRDGRLALRQALEAEALVCLTGGADDPLLGIDGRASIDHICASEGLRPRGVGAWPDGALPRGLSDHYGVWADLAHAGQPNQATASPARFPESLRSFVDQATWTYAKTMPEWPHEYLVRGQVDEHHFEALVRHIRAQGYPGHFYSKPMTYFDEDGQSYWTMGAPVEETIIINRCAREQTYAYRSKHGTLPA